MSWYFKSVSPKEVSEGVLSKMHLDVANKIGASAYNGHFGLFKQKGNEVYFLSPNAPKFCSDLIEGYGFQPSGEPKPNLISLVIGRSV